MITDHYPCIACTDVIYYQYVDTESFEKWTFDIPNPY